MDDSKDITICIHAGAGLEEVIKRQIEALKPLEEEYNVSWNNRIDRNPGPYPSYSQLVNDAVITSPTERIIFVNDRVVPTTAEAKKILYLLENGFAAATQWSVAYMGVTKELFRKIGWWDERFLGGGYEDDDFVLRLRLANLAYYESIESNYDFSFKSKQRIEGGGACAKSEPHFLRKWFQMEDYIARVVPEEVKPEYNNLVGPSRADISSKWKPWNQSQIGVDYYNVLKRLSGAGPSRTKWFMINCLLEHRRVLAAV